MTADRKEQRRFPRIFLQSIEAFKALVGAVAIWPEGQKTDVLDLSYSGAALSRPPRMAIEKGQAANLTFSFSGTQPVSAAAKIMRTDEKMIGVQFEPLSAQARLAFETFLTDNLLGLSLHKVDSKLFDKRQDFSHWFHGPKDTNVFIWSKHDPHIDKAIVEIDNQILVWNKGALSQGKANSDLVSAIEDYYSPVLYESVRTGVSTDKLVVSRAVKILSQMQQAPAVIRNLMDHLKEHSLS